MYKYCSMSTQALHMRISSSKLRTDREEEKHFFILYRQTMQSNDVFIG